MTLSQKYAEAKPVGVFGMNNWGGLEILDINDEEAVACFNFGNGRESIRKHKVHDIGNRPYIRKGGTKYYIDEIMKIW